MNITRTKKEEDVKPAVTFGELSPGQVFKVGKRLYLKTTNYGEAVRVTTGEIEETFAGETVVDEKVEGTFTYT